MASRQGRDVSHFVAWPFVICCRRRNREIDHPLANHAENRPEFILSRHIQYLSNRRKPCHAYHGHTPWREKYAASQQPIANVSVHLSACGCRLLKWFEYEAPNNRASGRRRRLRRKCPGENAQCASFWRGCGERPAY